MLQKVTAFKAAEGTGDGGLKSVRGGGPGFGAASPAATVCSSEAALLIQINGVVHRRPIPGFYL
jgi:hypothetical protein